MSTWHMPGFMGKLISGMLGVGRCSLLPQMDDHVQRFSNRFAHWQPQGLMKAVKSVLLGLQYFLKVLSQLLAAGKFLIKTQISGFYWKSKGLVTLSWNLYSVNWHLSGFSYRGATSFPNQRWKFDFILRQTVWIQGKRTSGLSCEFKNIYGGEW